VIPSLQSADETWQSLIPISVVNTSSATPWRKNKTKKWQSATGQLDVG
jgi:hypothetical protein